MSEKTLKILSIGNSFAEDTMEHMANIAKSAGLCDFKFAYLYTAGCSINRHYNHAMGDIGAYTYFVNTGDGWSGTDNTAISTALRDEEWDYISIQHGTGDKSRYTSPESYVNLPKLLKYVRDIVGDSPKLVFNMAWVAEPDSPHHEISSYGGNQALMYEKLIETTRSSVASLDEIYTVSPVGTSVQNARPYIDRVLTRDKFHLSLDLGRYIAGLTFLNALCGFDIEKVTWRPETVTEKEQKIAVAASLAAVKNPWEIGKL